MRNAAYIAFVSLMLGLLLLVFWWLANDSPFSTEAAISLPTAVQRDSVGENARSLASPNVHDVAMVAGTVVNQRGQPIPGLTLFAHPLQVAGITENIEGPTDPVYSTDTSADGSFVFAEIPGGLYTLRSRQSTRYEAVEQLTRSDAGPVALVVRERDYETISGRVVGARGAPLSGVVVAPSGVAGDRVVTEDGGRFTLDVVTGDRHRDYQISFQYPGYRDRFMAVRPAIGEAAGRDIGDVTLEPLGYGASVRGVVRDDAGQPVPGTNVRLFSRTLNRRLATSTDRYGEFTFPEVYHAVDYRLSVEATGPYLDVNETMLELPGNQEYLEIDLLAGSTGSINGRMVGPDGTGIAHRTLQLEGVEATRNLGAVTGDSDGYFTIDNIPPGPVALRSRTGAYLEVAGLTPDARALDYVDVVLDLGDRRLEGLVTDQYDAPVGGAQLELNWSRSYEQLNSRSLRLAVTDESGKFRFESLGGGERFLTVRAVGFGEVQLTIGEEDAWIPVNLHPTSD